MNSSAKIKCVIDPGVIDPGLGNPNPYDNSNPNSIIIQPYSCCLNS